MLNHIVLTINDPFFKLWYSFLCVIKLFNFLVFVYIVGVIRKMQSLLLLTHFTQYTMLFAGLERTDEDNLLVVLGAHWYFLVHPQFLQEAYIFKFYN